MKGIPFGTTNLGVLPLGSTLYACFIIFLQCELIAGVVAAPICFGGFSENKMGFNHNTHACLPPHYQLVCYLLVNFQDGQYTSKAQCRFHNLDCWLTFVCASVGNLGAFLQSELWRLWYDFGILLSSVLSTTFAGKCLLDPGDQAPNHMSVQHYAETSHWLTHCSNKSITTQVGDFFCYQMAN